MKFSAINEWLEFIDGDTTHIFNTNYGVHLASLALEDNTIIAWADEIQDPSRSVVFLIALRPILLYKGPSSIVPRHIITDGDRWIPLIRGYNNKFRQ